MSSKRFRGGSRGIFERTAVEEHVVVVARPRIIDLRDPAPAPPGSFPWFAFLLLNALNLADALLTRVAISSGVATEANPIADALGPIGKLVLVAAASYALARIRPRALWIPIAALAAVVVWTSAGLMANG